MIKTKIDKNVAIVQIMWLFLLFKITVVNQSVWMIVELAGCILCLAYVFSNIRLIRVTFLLVVVLFASSYIISSLFNMSYNGPYVTYTGIIFACKVIITFTVPWITIKKKGTRKVAHASWNCLMLYWIPAVITVLARGRDVIDNANAVYFIGNKFNVAYLNVIMLCLLLFLNDRHPNKNNRQLVLRWNEKKIGVFLFYAMIIYLDYFMKAYTGLFMVLFILLLTILSKILQFKVNNRWKGFLDFVKKPIVMTVSVILSGVVTLLLDTIMNIPTVASYLASIGKTGNILSRTLIYKNLAEIITLKPWIGYGYGSAIVSRYFGPNAQNGLAQVTIYIGVIGTVFLLLVTYYCGKFGKRNDVTTAPFLFSIYAFILSATVEITYSTHYFVLLAFYCACVMEQETIKEKNTK